MAAVRQSFAISSPGKIIVFGEHAVVHGRASPPGSRHRPQGVKANLISIKPAIAAALSLRSYLLVSTNQSSAKTITLDFPDVKLHHTWPVEALPWTMFAAKNTTPQSRITSLDQELIAVLQPLLDPISSNADAHTRTVHKHAAMAFLYILLSLESPSIEPRTYTLRSTIPIASGLGSSASVSVCLSAALLVQIGCIPLDWAGAALDSDATLELINNWAFVGELCIHGTPSGIDNTVATRGKAVWFKRNVPPAGPSVKLLHNFPMLPLLVVDTKQPRSTAVEVAKVKQIKEDIPAVADCALDGMGQITSTVVELIDADGFTKDWRGSIERLGQLIRFNHGLLATFGVSHPKLERVRDIIDGPNVGWTKLTGGGGGGCAFSLLDPQVGQDALKRAEQAIDKEGFERHEALLGAPGVSLLDFSKLPSDLAVHDLDAFRGASDSAAIEALMGITAPATEPHWQFFN